MVRATVAQLVLLAFPRGVNARRCEAKEVFQATKKNQWHFDMGTCTSVYFDHHKQGGLTEEAMPALVEALKAARKLEHFEVRGSDMWAGGTAMLGAYLRTSAVLKNMSLTDVHMRYMGARAISEALKANPNSSMQLLHVWDKSIGEAGAVELASIGMKSTYLERLYLSWTSFLPLAMTDDRFSCQEEKAGATACASWANQGQCLLNPDFMRRECTIACGFCRNYHNTTVTPGTAAATLAEVLKVNSVLTELRIVSNTIGNEGLSAIAKALESNTALTSLHILDVSIGDEGAMAMAQVLKTNTVLTELKLSGNSIGDEGAAALAEALKTNRVLKALDLRANKIGKAGGALLRNAHDSSTANGVSTLSELHLAHNPLEKDEL